MPVAVVKDLYYNANSYDPEYWVFTDPVTKALLDLTVPGFTVFGAVADSPDEDANTLLELVDGDFQRTSTGRVYHAPSSAESLSWDFAHGYYQFYLQHPIGQPVRFGEGRFFVSHKI